MESKSIKEPLESLPDIVMLEGNTYYLESCKSLVGWCVCYCPDSKTVYHFKGSLRDVLDHFIRCAKKEQMLATRKTTRGMVINVLGYNEYQDSIKIKSDTKSEMEATL